LWDSHEWGSGDLAGVHGALTVVLDSNIWLSEQMLRHSAGAAVRFYLRRHDARIALPEVVRLEVILHLSERMKELAATTRQAHRTLLPLAGQLRELVLPEDAELEAIAARAFEDWDVRLDPTRRNASRATAEWQA